MQHKGRLLFFVLSLGLLVGMILSACGPTPVPQGTNGPKHGGTLTDGLFEEPDSLLANLTNETYAVLVDATIWTPLIYGDNKGNLQPGLLKEVPSVANGDISADAKNYTLKLRSGLKWSDGQPITADDVVFTMNLWNNPAYGAKTSIVPLQSIDFTTLKAVDATTVTFSMKSVYVPLLAVQLTDPALSPMPKHIFGSMDPAAIRTSPENFQPTVSSGPFKVSERVKADHITVVKNANYWQADKGLPYLDKIVFKIIPDTTTVLTALQSGSIDTSWFLDITKLSSYQALKGYTVGNTPGTYEELLFNLHNPILSDIKVRQAITMAIDIDGIIKVAVHGQAERTCDEDIGSFAHDPSLQCNKTDPNAAKQLLDSAGWAMGSDGYRHKNGKILELRWSTTANNGRRQQGQTIGQANLKDVGIKIDIVNYPADTWFGSKLPSSDFDIGEYASSVGYDPDNPSTFLCSETPDHDPNGSNWGYYCNPAVDKAIHDEETNPDLNARKQAFNTIHQALMTDLPVMYLYNFGNLWIHRNNVHNYDPSPSGPSESWNVWEWWVG